MKKIVSWLLFVAIYLNLIAPLAVTTQAQGITKTMETKMSSVPDGFKFHLSEGSEGAETRVKQVLPSTSPMSDGEATGLLQRLPEIKMGSDDQNDFSKRAGSLPPPKTGKQIPVKFPSGDGRGTPKIDPGTVLEIVRFSPEGEVPLAPDLSVTFSQPMVAVTSQEEAAKYAPVELSPQVEGRWRWLGTRTLMFDTTKRFPMATKFTARVPAGTKAANGQVLQKDFVWTFTTPAPKVEQMFPANQIVRRDALMYLSFDQAIDPATVLRTVNVSGGGKKIALRLATDEEIAADGSVSYYSKQAQPGRWLAFRAVNADGSVSNALPAASAISVTVEKGTASAEGPLVTEKPQSFSFNTYSKFAFSGGYCGWRDNRNCSPFETWYLEFNNSIDASKFSKEMVKIEPAIEGLNIYPSGNYLYFQGYKKGRTSYHVTVDGALQDIFGQTLGQPATATIKVGSAEQSLYSQGGTMAVLDPTSKPTFSIYSTNHSSVNVRMYAVRPQDWSQFQNYVRHMNYDDGKRPPIPGRLVSDKTVTIENKPDELVETRIDISPALDGGFGNVIIDIKPTVRRDKYDRARVFTWLQATQIGLDAFVDNSELVGFATDLKTGKPPAGVDLSIYPNGANVSETAPKPDEGTVASWWNWLWGRGGPSVQAGDPNGDSISTETIEPAVSDRTGDNGVLRLPLPATQSVNGQNIANRKTRKGHRFPSGKC